MLISLSSSEAFPFPFVPKVIGREMELMGIQYIPWRARFVRERNCTVDFSIWQRREVDIYATFFDLSYDFYDQITR